MSILKDLLTSGQLYLEDYSEKAIALRKKSECKTPAGVYKDELISLGGKYNGNLQGGGGWIFSKKRRDLIEKFMESGKVEKLSKGEKETPYAKSKKLIESLTQLFAEVSIEEEKKELLQMLSETLEKVKREKKKKSKPESDEESIPKKVQKSKSLKKKGSSEEEVEEEPVKIVKKQPKSKYTQKDSDDESDSE